MRLLAECFEEMGGVPQVVLADRMGCLRRGVAANVVVPTAEYVRFATHFGFRPDFCEAADPESKGIVEALCRYAETDLVVPAEGWEDEGAANADARAWCAEVNARVHSEIAAVPDERLVIERHVLRPLPSLRPPLRRGEARQGRQARHRALRLRPLLGAQGAGRAQRRGGGGRRRGPRAPRR